MFRSPDPGMMTYGCLAAIAFGLYLWLRPPVARLTVRRMMGWVAVVALFLGVLAWSASKERVTMTARQAMPDGTTVVTTRYSNGFGITREVRKVER